MTIFNFGKKNDAEKQVLEFGNAAVSSGTVVKVLGAGCKSCHALFENAQLAAAGMDVKVEYITDMPTIMNYGVMSMPALVVNEQVVSAGKVLKPDAIRKLMTR